MDAIFDNIFVLIPVALILVFRVLVPRMKQRESQEQQEKQEQHPFLIEREKESDVNLGHWEAEKKPVKSIPKKNINRKQLKPVVSSLTEDMFKTQIPVKKETTKTPALDTSAKVPFPENLDYLPPIKKAFVFSEIFSQPRSL